jgi:hypothetical protein
LSEPREVVAGALEAVEAAVEEAVEAEAVVEAAAL